RPVILTDGPKTKAYRALVDPRDERLANGDGCAVAEPIADPSAGELSGGTADKDQCQCESRGRDGRPLSDQQEWEAHKKAASHDNAADAEKHENAKATRRAVSSSPRSPRASSAEGGCGSGATLGVRMAISIAATMPTSPSSV